MEIESELDYFRRTHEDLLDRFDSKIEAITNELTKLKNENIQLKEREKIFKKNLCELEEERDEFREKFRISERKSDECNTRLLEMEREVRTML